MWWKANGMMKRNEVTFETWPIFAASNWTLYIETFAFCNWQSFVKTQRDISWHLQIRHVLIWFLILIHIAWSHLILTQFSDFGIAPNANLASNSHMPPRQFWKVLVLHLPEILVGTKVVNFDEIPTVTAIEIYLTCQHFCKESFLCCTSCQ